MVLLITRRFVKWACTFQMAYTCCKLAVFCLEILWSPSAPGEFSCNTTFKAGIGVECSFTGSLSYVTVKAECYVLKQPNNFHKPICTTATYKEPWIKMAMIMYSKQNCDEQENCKLELNLQNRILKLPAGVVDIYTNGKTECECQEKDNNRQCLLSNGKFVNIPCKINEHNTCVAKAFDTESEEYYEIDVLNQQKCKKDYEEQFVDLLKTGQDYAHTLINSVRTIT